MLKYWLIDDIIKNALDLPPYILQKQDKRMDSYKVTLFGHRDLTTHRSVEKGLNQIFRKLIAEKPHIEVYIGRNGEFDVFAASVIKRVQNIFGRENLSMTLVIPYRLKDVEFYERYYDSVIIPEYAKTPHPKNAITKRNRWMIEKSDLAVCCVKREFGGAYAALKYAKKLGKDIINLDNAYEVT